MTAKLLHDVAVEAGIGTRGVAGQVTHVELVSPWCIACARGTRPCASRSRST